MHPTVNTNANKEQIIRMLQRVIDTVADADVEVVESVIDWHHELQIVGITNKGFYQRKPSGDCQCFVMLKLHDAKQHDAMIAALNLEVVT